MRELSDGPQCASPVLCNGLLFGVSDGGTAYCLEAATCRELWHQDLYGQHYASLVATRRHVYLCSTGGHTTLLASERQPRVVAEGELPEGIHASPALVDGELFLRTTGRLYCIRETAPGAG
jgi:outer membrane protein assembly factor BamB